MLGGRLGGIDDVSGSSAGAFVVNAIDVIYEADGAIGVGDAVQLDLGADNTDASLCIAGAANKDHIALGIYQGVGGTGAVTTVSGLTGNAAVDGNAIVIRAYGPAKAYCDISAASSSIGIPDREQTLLMQGSGLVGHEGTASPTDGTKPWCVSLENSSLSADGALNVFVQAL